jgi:colicin import membrane protein
LTAEVAHLCSQMSADALSDATAPGAASSTPNVAELQRSLADATTQLRDLQAAHDAAVGRAEDAKREAQVLRSERDSAVEAATRQSAEADGVMARLRDTIAAQEARVGEARTQASEAAAQADERRAAAVAECEAAQARLAEAEGASQHVQEAADARASELEAELASLQQELSQLRDKATAEAASRQQSDAQAASLTELLQAAEDRAHQSEAHAAEAAREAEALQQQAVQVQSALEAAMADAAALRQTVQRTEAAAAAAQEDAETAAQQAAEAQARLQAAEQQRLQATDEASQARATLEQQLREARDARAHAAEALEAARAEALEAARADAAQARTAAADSAHQLAAAQADVQHTRQQLASAQDNVHEAQALRSDLEDVHERLEAAEASAATFSGRALAAEHALAERADRDAGAVQVPVAEVGAAMEALAEARRNMARCVSGPRHTLGGEESALELLDRGTTESGDKGQTLWTRLRSDVQATVARCSELCAMAEAAALAQTAAHVDATSPAALPSQPASARSAAAAAAPRLPLSLPADASFAAASNSSPFVAVDMAPLLGDARGVATGGAPLRTGVVQRRDGARDAAGAPASPHASSDASQGDEELLAFRRAETVPFVRQLPARAQAVVAGIDEGCYIVAKGLLMVPAARLGVSAWLCLMHLWLLASLQAHHKHFG